ncbi:hypothetical protein WS62_02990 [Burkholderia sp. ABCPW 14]|uniref:hypothetical protein n=1 Tax=Burkholderia sp. ABCPW 14 TaxID=1637860 RepID=UPI000770D58A|nr:hypothetical protein [Burkholderia sp. ABCPW 14]KVD76114.1 hypothetical protein WS62_02990 [Burkholderia sp. ABCPW 14]
MSSRRKFLLSTSTAATLPLVSAVLSACNDSIAEPAISDAELARQMVGKLTAGLNDASTAATIEPYLMDVGFTWDLPTIAAAQIDRIVAYSFGNRPNAASGNTPTNGANQTALPDPGPVNEALADAIFRIRQSKSVKVYAQWEIARFLTSKYQMTDVHSIEPVVAADGSITYLSTDGVAAAIAALEGGGAAMGNVAVVGHRDHAKRCIQTSRARGMKAAAVAEVALPTLYDPQSGQAWTRRRDLYLVHDMYAQLAALRANLIAAAYPNG